jgi:hypothetical protein
MVETTRQIFNTQSLARLNGAPFLVLWSVREYTEH